LIELGTNNLPLTGAEVITFFAGVMNSQSAGCSTLICQPSDPSVIDLEFCSHPYDKRAAIEWLRSLIEFPSLPLYAAITERRIEGLSGSSDEEIWEHGKRLIAPISILRTGKMGKESDELADVDNEFKVRGVQGVRVVGHGVAPLMANNHTQ
jgi:choline dehydrogenase-like flavoprotein